MHYSFRWIIGYICANCMFRELLPRLRRSSGITIMFLNVNSYIIYCTWRNETLFICDIVLLIIPRLQYSAFQTRRRFNIACYPLMNVSRCSTRIGEETIIKPNRCSWNRNENKKLSLLICHLKITRTIVNKN